MTVTSKIISKENPEWGTWTVMEDCGGWFVIKGRAGSRVLNKGEVRFWEVV